MTTLSFFSSYFPLSPPCLGGFFFLFSICWPPFTLVAPARLLRSLLGSSSCLAPSCAKPSCLSPPFTHVSMRARSACKMPPPCQRGIPSQTHPPPPGTLRLVPLDTGAPGSRFRLLAPCPSKRLTPAAPPPSGPGAALPRSLPWPAVKPNVCALCSGAAHRREIVVSFVQCTS